MANEYRSRLNEILQEPLESGAICICPDLWSDNHRKVSYLGMTASFITKQWEYKTVYICCKPFTADDHSGKNLLIVSIVFMLQYYIL